MTCWEPSPHFSQSSEDLIRSEIHRECKSGSVREVEAGEAPAETLTRWLHGIAKGCVFRGHVSAGASTWDGETVVIQKNRTRKANSL
jgi:hypothetical protein